MVNEFKKPNKERVDLDNLEYWRDNKYFGDDYKYNGNPFTGFAVISSYDNNVIEHEVEYINGEPLGWEVEYFENGKIKEETLNYGENSVFSVEYDEEGNKIAGGLIASKEIYEECLKEIQEKES